MKRAACLLALVAAAVAGCTGPFQQNLPPAEMMMHPGPGVDGPGPGVMMHQPAIPTPNQVSQLTFVGPEGMVVNWDVMMPGMYDSAPLVCPGRYNFPQGAIYRLKLTNVPARPGVELYPTLEVGPSMPRTNAFIAHNAVPIQFTDEDFDQVLSGNFVTKVIYLPDSEYQELALAGVETLVSTRLDPGMDPLVEADRRGAILAVVRLGNRDWQIPNDAMAGNPTVAQVSYEMAMGPFHGGMAGPPLGMPCNTGQPPSAQNYISGVTGPQYGMPMCGTPIGLPGPPHIPLGVPAGLQKHVMRNHTNVDMPGPTEKMRIDVRQDPGFSYPKPVSHVQIVEQAQSGLGSFFQPLADRHQGVWPGGQGSQSSCGACAVPGTCN